MKKISELDTKAFLGEDGAAENSYLLINYAEDANDTPVTYKATLKELGQAIAYELQLPLADGSGGLYFYDVSEEQGSKYYTDGNSFEVQAEADLSDLTNGTKFYAEEQNVLGVPLFYDSNNSTVNYYDGSTLDLNLAVIGTSNEKPAIYNLAQSFIGYLSEE